MKILDFDNPISRVGFLVFCLAVVIAAACLLANLSYGYGGFGFDSDFRLFEEHQPYWFQRWLTRSIVMMIIGGWLAWFYKPTIGRLVRWIRFG